MSRVDDTRRPVDRVRGHGGACRPRSTVAVGTGQTSSGQWITFAGGTRQMLDIAAALDGGSGPVPATVPSWAVLSASPVDAA